MVRVSAAKSDPPTSRSRTLARAAQQRERERVARRRERDARHRERRKRRSEEFRLREQQGLSSPGTEEYSSSDEEEEEEEEEEVREQVLPDRWEPAPPSPESAPVAGVPSAGAGAEGPATRQSATEAARLAEAPARASEASVCTAEGGCVRPDHAALVEGVAGGRRCGGSGKRGLARRGRGLEATAGDVVHRAAVGRRRGTAGAGRGQRRRYSRRRRL
jgi:hypothetical protein